LSQQDKDAKELARLEKEARSRLASRLEELRRQEGARTLKFVGDSSQLGSAHITLLLQGKKNVTLKTLVKLAYAFNVDITDLLKAGPTVKSQVKRGRPRTRRTPK